MCEKLRIFTVACLLMVAASADAGVPEDISAGEPMATVLRNAVGDGATIWEAVVDAYLAAPDRLSEILVAAFTMLSVLPQDRACEDRPQTACEATIVQRLVEAGADPVEVWDLAARSRSSGTGGGGGGGGGSSNAGQSPGNPGQSPGNPGQSPGNPGQSPGNPNVSNS